MSQENDILHAYGQTKELIPFTENDVLKKIGLTKVTMKELRDLIEPSHLDFICELYGMSNGDLCDEKQT